MAKSMNMVWRPHIARVKTKNILNLRIGLFKTPLSYVELIVLRTDYLRGPLFVRGPHQLGGSGGASFGTVHSYNRNLVNIAYYHSLLFFQASSKFLL